MSNYDPNCPANDNMKDIPIVPLPGSENWADAYIHGKELARRFPGQDADQLMLACEYINYGPLSPDPDGQELRTITNLVMVQQGWHDGPHWIWYITLNDGSRWEANGWCDYTGWDCQADLVWRKLVEEIG